MFDLNDFMVTSGSELLGRQRDINEPGEKIISVIGGGATGIQFLFEIAYFLRRQKVGWRLRLIHGEDRVLNQFRMAFRNIPRHACLNWILIFILILDTATR